MTTRRAMLAGIGAGTVGLFAGCLDLATGEDLEFSAEPAEADPATVEEAEYTHETTERFTVEETFEVADRERDIAVTNWTASYVKRIDLQPAGSVEAALFSVVSTPNFEIAGRSVNPVADLDHDELLQEFNAEFEGVDGIDDIRLVEEDTETVLDSTADLSVFEATAIVEGQEVDALLYVTSTENEDDIVVSVGAHIDEFQGLQIDEEENIRALMRSIEHPVEGG